MLICMGVYVVLAFMVGSQDRHVDVMGHAGGIVSGVMVMCAWFKQTDGEKFTREVATVGQIRSLEAYRRVGQILCVIFYVGGLTAFYTLRHPQQQHS
ncbi:hypothetical protein FGO68_gene9320 [Halteria grandinella]|uniref:Uncharacterized protein n=1 Tax=Halteria grandinella TaxID=5974 RepID=A0A8J8P0B8_HALGN|nr:hypothetical protein FGO68_gene9320 [Halteria grandinella]